MGQLSPCCSVEREALAPGAAQVPGKFASVGATSKSEAAALAAAKAPRVVSAASGGTRLMAEDLLDGALEAAFEGRARAAVGRDGSDDDDARSEGGQSATSVVSRSSSVFGDMTREQRQEAKLRVKTFTQEVVRGRPFSAVAPTGELRPCFLKMTRKLDVLHLKANKKATHAREIPLIDIDGILAGEGVESEGLQTPLSELSVTLALKDQTFITFNMSSFDEQDTFVKCFTMFVEEAHVPRG